MKRAASCLGVRGRDLPFVVGDDIKVFLHSGYACSFLEIRG